jgi:hypothetical protein
MAGGKVARFLFVTLRERLICSLSCEKKVSNDSIVGRTARRGNDDRYCTADNDRKVGEDNIDP